MGVSSSDESDTIATRPVEDKGWSICGGLATWGSPAAWTSRSVTTWRASSRSVPDSKVMTTEERPGNDTDSMLSRNATPLSKSCSSGMVISRSTSAADSPRASVWTSTVTGLNSGNTSVFTRSSCAIPKTKRAAAATTTIRLNLSAPLDHPTHHELPTPSKSRFVSNGVVGRPGGGAVEITARLRNSKRRYWRLGPLDDSRMQRSATVKPAIP